jgi:hypothetical protein
MNLINKINFKIFFYFIIPVSNLTLSAIINFTFLDISNGDALYLMVSQLIAIYATGAIWIFLYSKIREIFIDKRTKNIETSNVINTLLRINERYMNLSNYMISVFVAWIILTVIQLSTFL